MKKKTQNELKKLFNSKGYDVVTDYIPTTHTKIQIIDCDGYRYLASWDYVNHYGIDRFSKFNPFSIENIKTYINKNNINCEILSDVYVNNDGKLLFRCACGNEFYVSWHHFHGAKQYHCYKCAKLESILQQRFTPEYIKNTFSKYGYFWMEEEYFKNTQQLTFIDEEGYWYYSTFARFLVNHSADRYNRSNIYSIRNLQHFMDINGINATLIDQKYIDSRAKLMCICECGEIFKVSQVRIKTDKRALCHKCLNHKSTYERKVEQWLIERGIKYIVQYRFDKCINKRSLPFDFYLPQINTCIEVQGKQHYTPCVTLGGEKSFEYIKINDSIKKDFCEKNNIRLICVPYNILSSKEQYKKNLDNLIS